MEDPEKRTYTNISEIASQSPNSRNGPAHDGSALTLTQWPLEPKPLAEDRLTFFLNMAYDMVLVYTPILLLVKVGLIIHAAKIDAGKSGLIGSSVSGYTTNLIRVNTQVCSDFSLIFHSI
jgi:hypothetical protein